jgi:hypothetical protein
VTRWRRLSTPRRASALFSYRLPGPGLNRRFLGTFAGPPRLKLFELLVVDQLPALGVVPEPKMSAAKL